MKKALVLSGGGAKGGYQLGVWRAIRELGIEFDIVTGTSVGALNGVFFVQGAYDIAIEAWSKITPQTLLDVKAETPAAAEKELFLNALRGGTEPKPLEEMVKKYLDEDKVRSSKTKFGLVTVNFPIYKVSQLSIDDIPDGKLADYVMASVAAFPMFKPKEIDGKRYIDGGYYDNIPVNLAIDMGAEEVFMVDLVAPGIKRKTKKKIKIQEIRPSRPLDSFMFFDRKRVLFDERLGYLDTMRHFGKIQGVRYGLYIDGLDEKLMKIQIELSNMFKKILEHSKGDTDECVKLKEFYDRYHYNYDEKYKRSVVDRVLQALGAQFKLDDSLAYTIDEFNEKIYKVFSDNIEKINKKEKVNEDIETIYEYYQILSTALVKDIDVKIINALLRNGMTTFLLSISLLVIGGQS